MNGLVTCLEHSSASVNKDGKIPNTRTRRACTQVRDKSRGSKATNTSRLLDSKLPTCREELTKKVLPHGNAFFRTRRAQCVCCPSAPTAFKPSTLRDCKHAFWGWVYARVFSSSLDSGSMAVLSCLKECCPCGQGYWSHALHRSVAAMGY